jgi:myo-inositol-1(or 4)-monophosphatase
VVDPEELLALASEAGQRAAALLAADGNGAGASFDHGAGVETKSSPTDLVTELDRRAERLIVDLLLDARPHDAVVGEEGGERQGTSAVRWVVDPLDGTTNFVYRFPAYAVSIAAEVGGRVVAGAVTDVVHREQFTAIHGGGAHLDGVPISTSVATTLGTALVGTGFSYRSEDRRRQAAALPRILPAVRDIRRVGSAALDLCWVACGRLDAFWERGLAPWDRAAGELIAREAGARVGPVGEGGETVLAAAPALYEALESLLTDAGAAW